MPVPVRHPKSPGRVSQFGGPSGGGAPSAAVRDLLASEGYRQEAREKWSVTPTPDEAVLPEADLLAQWSVQDQRPRNVCVAFAAAAAAEYLRLRKFGRLDERVSAQYIYWMMRDMYPPPVDDRPEGWAIGATRLRQARDVLEKSGVCPERLSPFYLGLLDPATLPEGEEPSDEAKAAADPTEFATGDYGSYPEGSRPTESLVNLFHARLKDGRPIAAGFPMFGTQSHRVNWHAVDALGTGEVLGPLDEGSGILPGAVSELGHVVCIIGYAPDPVDADEGWFIFRNSWGVEFGHAVNSRFPELPPGYGTISASYVEHFCWEYYIPQLA